MSLKIASGLIAAYNDSLERITKFAAKESVSKLAFGPVVDRVVIYRFMQMWKSACGGIYDITVPPSIFTEEVIVFAYPFRSKLCHVYFGGRFGYTAELNSDLEKRIKELVVPDTEQIKEITKVYEAYNR